LPGGGREKQVAEWAGGRMGGWENGRVGEWAGGRMGGCLELS
jgi:hypothetical protein